MYTTDEGQRQVELCAIIYEPASGGAPRPFSLLVSTSDGAAGIVVLCAINVLLTIHMCFLVFPDDYVLVIDQVLDFVVGDERACHVIDINDDDICENFPNEDFFSYLVLDSRGRRIDVDPEQAQVIIDDTNELECG